MSNKFKQLSDLFSDVFQPISDMSDDVMQKIADLSAEVAYRASQFEQSCARLDSLSAKLDSVEIEANRSRSAAGKCDNKLYEMNQEFEGMKQELEGVKPRLEEARQPLARLESLSEAVAPMKDAMVNLSKAQEDLLLRINSHQDNLEVESKRAKERDRLIGESLQEIRNDVNLVKENVDSLNQKRDQEFERLGESILSVKSNYDRLAKQAQREMDSLKAAATENSMLQVEQFQRLDQEVKQLNKQADAKSLEGQQVSKAIVKLRQQLEKLQADVESMRLRCE